MLGYTLSMIRFTAEEAFNETSTNPDIPETTATVEEAVRESVEKANHLLDSLKGMVPSLIAFCVDLFISMLIFIVGKLAIKIILRIVDRFFERTKIEVSVRKFMHSFVNALLYVLLSIVIMSQLGIETTSFIAVMTSASLAIGLAFQGSLSNFAGGVLLLIMKPFKVGDYIIEAAGGREGTVERIDISYTTLITPDNRKIIIPNGGLSNSSLINVTSLPKRRVDFSIGISYSSDIALAKRILEEIGKEHELVLDNEEIFVFVQELADSSVVMGLRVWCSTNDYWTVKFDVNERIKNRFDEEGIEIPFNQLVVHMEQSE